MAGPFSDPKRLGRQGEDAARKYLKKRGYRILARNYTCPVGEIDLVGLDDDTLVFVEVKTVRSDEGVAAIDQLHARKKGQVRRAARFYISAHRAHDLPARFDVVTVTVPDEGQPRIEHIEDAFGE